MVDDHSPGTSRRFKALVACTACKSRKGRCSGTSPCDACLATGTACVIDEALDGRRRAALNRRLEEVIHHKWMLAGLLLALRVCRNVYLTRILELINVGATLPTLAVSIVEALNTIPTEEDRYGHHSGVLQGIMTYLEEQSPESPPSTPRTQSMYVNAQNDAPFSSHRSNQFTFTSTSISQPLVPQSSQALDPGDSHNSSLVVPFLISTETIPQQNELATQSYASQSHIIVDEGSLDHMIRWLKALDSASHAQPSIYQRTTTNHENQQAPISHTILQIKQQVNRSVPIPVRVSSKRGSNRILIPKPVTLPSTTQQQKKSTNEKRPLRPPLFSTQSAPVCACRICVSISRRHSFTRTIHPATELSDSPTAYETPSIGQPVVPTQELMLPHMVLPSFKPVETPVERAIISYLELARSLLSAGAPLATIFGPERPCFDLLLRNRAPSDEHSVCNFAAEFCASIEGWELPEKIGIAYMLVFTIRWMILPSKESYDKIAGMCRPTSMQVLVPHNACIEVCPFPSMRDALCQQFRCYLAAFAQAVSCNWPYHNESCIERSADSHQVMVSDGFQRHITSAVNWSINSQIFNMFPECQGQIRTHY